MPSCRNTLTFPFLTAFFFFYWICPIYSEDCTYYGDYDSLPVSVVTCSDHPPGLYTNSTWGYNSATLIRNVNQIHFKGKLYATAWNAVKGTGDAAHCLHCLQVSTGSKSVLVTVIDMKGAKGVDLSDAAFDCLFGEGAHIGGGTFPVTVRDLGAGPCAGGGGCGVAPPPPPTVPPLTPPPPPTPVDVPDSTCKTGYFDIRKGSNFIAYWGQNSGGWEKPLKNYCAAGDTTFTAFHIAFLNYFGNPNQAGAIRMNLAGHCGNPCTGSQPGLLCCPDVGSDIALCQSRGKKVLLSLGGAHEYGVYSLTESTGTMMGDFLWNYFLGGNPPNGDPRPFGSVQLDGIDLDIENANSGGYAALVRRLRTLYAGGRKTYYVSGAPQCVYPDASLGPSSNTALTVGGAVTLDYIVVQFYNNGVCNIGQSQFVTAFNNWARTSVSKVLVGFLGLPDSGSGYVSSSDLARALQGVWDNPKFGGIMVWDSGTVYRNTEGGSIPYATTIANKLRAKFPCSGQAPPSVPVTAPPPPYVPTPPPAKVPTTPPKTPTTPPKTPPSAGVAWSPNGVPYSRGTCVQYGGKYYQCLQAHTSLIGWDPVSAPALWKAVSSCSAAAEETSTQFSKYSAWLIPTIIVVVILFIAIIVVLCKKKQRARGYSSELGVPDITLPAPQLSTEEVTLTSSQQSGLPPPLEKSHSPTTTTTSGRHISPTSGRPFSPSERPLSPSQRPTSPFHTDEPSKVGGGGGPNELTILTTGQTKTTSPTRTSPVSPLPDSSMETQEGAARRRKSIQLLSPSTESEPIPTLPPLPSGWERRRDAASGQDFYYNNSSGVSQWEFPEAS